MQAELYTLENIPALILGLSSLQKSQPSEYKKLMELLYKLPRYRSRTIPFAQPTGELRFTLDWWKKNTGTLYKTQYPWGSYRTFSDHTEKCWDYVTNSRFNEKKYKIPDDTGSEFLRTLVAWKNVQSVNYDRWETPDYSSLYKRHGYGPIGPNPPSTIDDGIQITSPTADVPATDYQITSWGPTAFRMFKPAKPTISIATFIGESRDLPRLLKARVEGLKTISDWWLAVQYGWKPLLNDIMSMLNFVDKMNAQVEFFLKNAGKPIRRRGTVTTSSSVDLIYDSFGAATDAGLTTRLNGRFYPTNYNQCRTTITRDLKQSIVFNGEFVYWFSGHPPDRTTLIAKLAGLEVTPQVVWNLLPWSWLIDWFTNFGDLVDNLKTEVADSQTARYAYITSKTERKYKFAMTDGYNSCGIERHFLSTCRKFVHPFGLSYSSDLTVRQASILAALGISRSPRPV